MGRWMLRLQILSGMGIFAKLIIMAYQSIMKHRLLFIFVLLSIALSAYCSDRRYRYPDIFDISYTPGFSDGRCTGWFVDAGSWIGFTAPERHSGVNGFCGPFSLDMNRRRWIATAAMNLKTAGSELRFKSSMYYPGELRLLSTEGKDTVSQQLNFITDELALVHISNRGKRRLMASGLGWGDDITVSVKAESVVATHPSGETFAITFPKGTRLVQNGNNYSAEFQTAEDAYVAFTFITSGKRLSAGLAEAQAALAAPLKYESENSERWEAYLKNILRDDMPAAYDRIAVKAVSTLLSNHRTPRGGLLHAGFVPSHAVGYFVGFWAWDSWRFCAGAAKFAPELAKNNIRAMFDYQQPDGMIIDCIFTDPADNNARDSKPPLVCWAVDEIYKHTGDKNFLREMYPKLLKYYKWWYAKRDHNGNGICEYGSTDGTLEAAAWESGMDNAIRFDSVRMLGNKPYTDAWSMDQESVDLNAYLALECKLLRKFAAEIGEKFDAPQMDASSVADYFFDEADGFFYDRRLADGAFVREPGCEAYTPLWTGIARRAQVERMLPMLTDSHKFSTYIPFPTIAADNPKYNPRGYWRGPIWLDQTYFAIKGLRNYGYDELADRYTEQVFDRLSGLRDKAPIHENYGTHTGERLKAPHFSWSASHLLMLYDDYRTSDSGKQSLNN